MPTPFAIFADLCEALEATTKRNEKKHHIARYLKRLDAEEIQAAVCFLIGKPFPEPDERVLDIGGRTIWKLQTQDTTQSTLVANPLTVQEVARAFDAIAKTKGPGSRTKKQVLLETLFRRATPKERKTLTRILSREMRIGAVEGVVMEGIAEAGDTPLPTIQRANMLLGNLGEVAKTAITQGKDALAKTQLRLFTPMKPMLAEMSYSIAQVMKEHGGRTALEYKFDGARIQAHKKGDRIRIYSRRLSEVTDSVPDIVAQVQCGIKADEAVVEGEAVAQGGNGRPLPFQDLMRRFTRVHNIEDKTKQIPFRLYLFDIMYLDGEVLIDKPYKERWEILHQTVDPTLLAPRTVTGSVDEAQKLLDASMRAGHEGLMAKALDSEYAPGVRGKKWYKIKPYETLDLVITAAEWGYGRREGWLSNYHLAALDEDTGEYLSLGKTFKGLTDQEFQEITQRLQALKTRETEYTVYVRPSIVVEVAYNEIQRSPHYKSGYALRFARILHIRDDKGPSEADTLDRVKILYQQQFEAKAQLPQMNST
jgi:DNA ligase-1